MSTLQQQIEADHRLAGKNLWMIPFAKWTNDQLSDGLLVCEYYKWWNLKRAIKKEQGKRA